MTGGNESNPFTRATVYIGMIDYSNIIILVCVVSGVGTGRLALVVKVGRDRLTCIVELPALTVT